MTTHLTTDQVFAQMTEEDHAHGQFLLATTKSYARAERLVDALSDGGFPVAGVRIVGDGLHSVERVNGRLTGRGAAGAGAAGGAWFGLLVGLLLGMFATGPAWPLLLLGGAAFGAVWGGVFGYATQWATRGRRDFSSSTSTQADRYEVYVDPARRAEAIRLTSTL